ncbi:matrix-remodeling-associated protein 5-like isoform X2 [Takifugu rubripes]|uniref:matrix-remodeling-associated protein 5-like isoform X2 n=1 Tax=Takifugu rubripes TaxID=31033 RepID=UPI001145E708|nr:matrix-remodeling-associated protein 5-like isoform X2 [Takifugu rubripes]
MEAVVVLLLMVLRISNGVETSCDGRQDKTQCYGALGGTLVLQLMDKVPEILTFKWGNSTGTILNRIRNGSVTNTLSNRSEFISHNGTLRMNSLNRTDGGEYKLEIFKEDGVRTAVRTLQLNIQAPVSTVRLTSECLSQGEKRMSCSSVGDSPQYSWTLDGDTLTDDQVLSGNNETNEIILKQTVSGRLVCLVRNHVSEASVTEMISTCGVETSCDGRQDKTQCYGALGGTLVLQLMDKVPEILTFKWWNSKGMILIQIRNRPVMNRLSTRLEFISHNGTLRINSLRRTDGGEYKLEIFNEDGERTAVRTQQLNIQAPVSTVRLTSECLSQGEKRMSCSSDGDSPQYSWTLDGDTLTDDQLLSGNNETNEIILNQTVSGRLVCLVRNHVSEASVTEMISTCGVETSCDGRQNKTQCYAALGGTLVLQLMDKVPEILTFRWRNSKGIILNRIGNGPVTNKLSNRSEFISHNGTLRMNSLNRTDGGEYKLEIFNEDGVRTAVRTQQLNIQAPVSTVRLTSECLSQGEKRMSCSSDGDSPQYSWTLDGNTLTDDQLLSVNNETNEIILKQTVSGRLVCLVRNHVSEASVTEMISTCGVETSCDGRQDKTQCYGALGGTLVLQLMDKVPEILTFTWSNPKKFIWWNSNVRILSRIGNGPVMNRLSTRSEFISHNGTLRMNSLSRTDGGEYKLEIFNEDGEITAVRTLQLNIQAPVSTVRLTSECLSQGEKRMSCSSDGDSPQYSWTLDGDTLTDDQLLSGNNETNEIILKQTVSGRLVCLVRNHVSEASVTEMISTCGVETSCDGRQDKTQCYGALGGTLVLQLMDKVPEILTFKWWNSKGMILIQIRNRPVMNRLSTRLEFISHNGTLRMNSLSRTDGGEYTLDIFKEDGERTAVRTQQLNIQAPVSTVRLTSECLSQGEKRMSCSSVGDSPQYSWTLDGDTLTDDQLLSGNNETNEIILKQTVSGRLVCLVRNHVSEASVTEMISTCGYIFIECQLSNGTHIRQWVFAAHKPVCIKVSALDNVLLTLFFRALVMIFIFSGIFIYFSWKKKKIRGTAEGSTIITGGTMETTQF